MVIMFRGSTYHVHWEETEKGWFYRVYRYHPYLDKSDWMFSIELPKSIPPEVANEKLLIFFPDYYILMGVYAPRYTGIVGAWEVHEDIKPKEDKDGN